MTPMPLPLVSDVVLIGGGHSHALVLKSWGMAPLPGARLTVINPGPTAPYTGMLPGFVAGHYDREELEIDLIRLARFAGARIVLGHATAIDRVARTITVGDRRIAYDVASIDIGITSELPDLPGFPEFAVAAKPLGPFAGRWTGFIAGDGPADVAIIGAGVGGVELSMAMAHALRSRSRRARITVIDRATALPGTATSAARRLRARVRSFDVELIENKNVSEITPTEVRLADGRAVPSTFTVSTAGARPQPWLRDTGLDLQDGFIRVDQFLRSSDPSIYACGDAAHIANAPRPKAGVYAVRAAPIIYANLRAELTGSARKSFNPQGDYLKLISLGGREAVGEKFGVAVEGPWVWRWKDRIDRRFMDGLASLPDMPAPTIPPAAARGVREALAESRPLCGGCGSKVGGAALGRALASLPASRRTDILTRAGDDAAVLDIGGHRQVVTTDHLRAFTADPWLLARVAALHAMGDVWAMGAVPQAALAQIILPPLAPELQERTLEEILESASKTFGDEGAEIVGGHTTTGAELSIGFTVTGLADRDPITLAGAQPGDALILTRPIGSGTILAAEMRKAARGPDVVACLDEMTRSQGVAAALLESARAMTDVTGFGLAGHLLALLDASGVGARIDLDSIPFYDGAEDLAAAGIRSTIWDANHAVSAPRTTADEGPRRVLLFDPQTSGGLLAALPSESVNYVLQSLADEGYSSAVIGDITDGEPVIEVR